MRVTKYCFFSFVSLVAIVVVAPQILAEDSDSAQSEGKSALSKKNDGANPFRDIFKTTSITPYRDLLYEHIEDSYIEFGDGNLSISSPIAFCDQFAKIDHELSYNEYALAASKNKLKQEYDKQRVDVTVVMQSITSGFLNSVPRPPSNKPLEIYKRGMPLIFEGRIFNSACSEGTFDATIFYSDTKPFKANTSYNKYGYWIAEIVHKVWISCECNNDQYKQVLENTRTRDSLRINGIYDLLDYAYKIEEDTSLLSSSAFNELLGLSNPVKYNGYKNCLLKLRDCKFSLPKATVEKSN